MLEPPAPNLPEPNFQRGGGGSLSDWVEWEASQFEYNKGREFVIEVLVAVPETAQHANRH